MAKSSDSTYSSSAGSFWDLVKRSARGSRKQRPTFVRSWIIGSEEAGGPTDTRENNYVRSSIFSDDGPPSRSYVVEPLEFSLDDRDIDAVSDVILSLGMDPPPPSVMEKEADLRKFVEQRASRMLSSKRVKDPQVLSRIVVQYTVGYGVVEHLLRDERVQDIYIDPPHDSKRIRVELGGMEDPALNGSYHTNICITGEEVKRLISILRFTSGRPFSEASPVLECEIPVFRSRMTAVSPPLSQSGISIAIRKHSHDPWTLLRLIRAGSMTSQAASFLDLCMNGRSSILIAGPRGAGKSSLLGGLLFQMDPEQRLIAIEDTPELPLLQMKDAGLNVVGLKIDDRSNAEKALRTALRLGESLLVMGEVRGPETRTLYEAMSAGTAGSAVLGTFHADSASSVYKRAVEDLGVSPGSFSATDIVVICGVVQPKGRRARYRRVVQIAEYIKDGPPGRFRDLFLYDSSKDMLAATEDLSSSHTFSRIAALWGMNVKDIVKDWKSRALALDHSLEYFRGDALARPDTMISVLGSMRTAREILDGPAAPEKFIPVFKEQMEDEEEWIV